MLDIFLTILVKYFINSYYDYAHHNEYIYSIRLRNMPGARAAPHYHVRSFSALEHILFSMTQRGILWRGFFVS
jgi:hypothetical protein